MALCHLLSLSAEALGLRVKEIHVSAVKGLVSWQEADYGPHIQTCGEHRSVGHGCCQHTAAPKHGHLDALDVLGPAPVPAVGKGFISLRILATSVPCSASMHHEHRSLSFSNAPSELT